MLHLGNAGPGQFCWVDLAKGTARIAHILDCVGAQVGLWEPIGSSRGETTHA
jgi:hypothetical protein